MRLNPSTGVCQLSVSDLTLVHLHRKWIKIVSNLSRKIAFNSFPRHSILILSDKCSMGIHQQSHPTHIIIIISFSAESRTKLIITLLLPVVCRCWRKEKMKKKISDPTRSRTNEIGKIEWNLNSNDDELLLIFFAKFCRGGSDFTRNTCGDCAQRRNSLPLQIIHSEFSNCCCCCCRFRRVFGCCGRRHTLPCGNCQRWATRAVKVD